MTHGGHDAPPPPPPPPPPHVDPPHHVDPPPAHHHHHHVDPPPYTDNSGSIQVIYIPANECTPLIAREDSRRQEANTCKSAGFFLVFALWLCYALWIMGVWGDVHGDRHGHWDKHGRWHGDDDPWDLLTDDRLLSSDIPQLSMLPSHLLPKTYHHHSTSNRRLVVVGDIHGVDSALEELLDTISFNTELDHLVVTGDMVDKGPSSHGVISRLRSLNASCVRGNHEDNVLNYYDAKNETSAEAIGESQIAKDLTAEDLEWIRKCPLIFRLGQLPGHKQKETVAVHAGLLPGVKLSKQEPIDVMRMRSISEIKGKARHKKHSHSRPKYQAYEDRNEGDLPWWKVWNKFQARLPKHERTMVIYGHDSRTGLNQKDWSFGLDSGCVGGGKLSALIIEGEDEKTGEPRMHVESVKCDNYRQ